MRLQFGRQHCVDLRRLLEPELLRALQSRIDQAQFRPVVHAQGIGPDSDLEDNLTFHALHFLTNTPRFFQLIQELTNCPPIGCFQGRVYRLMPDAGHSDSWHDDMVEGRMIGMSINLSTRVFLGGVFQLRDRNSKGVLYEVANTGFGDGIICRLARRKRRCGTAGRLRSWPSCRWVGLLSANRAIGPRGVDCGVDLPREITLSAAGNPGRSGGLSVNPRMVSGSVL